MGLGLLGWRKKALYLRTIVSAIPEIREMPEHDIERFEAMRAFRRGTITADQLRARIEALPRTDPVDHLHEPAEIYGWVFDATIAAVRGSPWWLVKVSRKTTTATAKDKALMGKVIAELGGDSERDLITISDVDTCVENRVPLVYMWRNTLELQEIQIRDDGDMRIVPRGSRPTDGYQKLVKDQDS